MSDKTDEVTPDSDWESMLDSGQLDKSLALLAVKPPVKVLTENGDHNRPEVNGLGNPNYSGRVTILTNDSRTQYRPQEPKLKILKRPNSQTDKQQEKSQPKAQQKSLQQREAEYAEARQRILGSAKPPSPVGEGKQNVGTQQQQVKQNGGPQQQQQQGKQNGGPQQQQSNRKSLTGVGPATRHPRGPDGSKGFQAAPSR